MTNKKLVRTPILMFLGIVISIGAVLNLASVVFKYTDYDGNIWIFIALNLLASTGGIGIILLKNWGRLFLNVVLTIVMAHGAISIFSLFIKTTRASELRVLGYPGLTAGVLLILVLLVVIPGAIIFYINAPKMPAKNTH